MKGGVMSMNLTILMSSLFVASGAGAPVQLPPAAKIDMPVKEIKVRDLNLPNNSPLLAIDKFRGKKAVVLGFVIEHCVVCNLYEPRIKQLVKKFSGEAVFYAVYCDKVDNPSSMKKWLAKKSLGLHLLDDRKGVLLSYFRAVTSPTFVLIDKQGVLRYMGAFDDNPGEDVKRHYLEEALTAVSKSAPVAVKRYDPIGCKIIRNSSSV